MTVDPDDVEHLVEATDFECLCLWERHHDRFKWEEINPGFMATIGEARNVEGKPMPVAVCVSYARLNGHLVAFYEATSMVTDSEAVEAFLKKKFQRSRGRTNAMNFHNVLHEVRE